MFPLGPGASVHSAASRQSWPLPSGEEGTFSAWGPFQENYLFVGCIFFPFKIYRVPEEK